MTADALGADPIYLDPFDYAIDTEPHPVWKHMRDEQPVHWNEPYEAPSPANGRWLTRPVTVQGVAIPSSRRSCCST